MEWEVWLADGRRVTSQQMAWAELPDIGVLVVRWWGATSKGINWGEGMYGDPMTHKRAGMVADDVFVAALNEAQAQARPPSQR